MSSPDRTVLVLYGSETGNAQDMAEELDKLCQRLHFTSRVEELDSVGLNELLQHQLVLFVISTTGQGDVPHNALSFWKKLLRKKLPPGCLGQMKYSCVGLGDSTYLKFNWAARKLIRRLGQLGATAFIEPCEADEQFPEGIEGSFVRWADGLRNHLIEHFPDPKGRKPVPDDEILPPKWSLAPALNRVANTTNPPVNGSKTKELPTTPPVDHLPIPCGHSATLVKNERMTPPSHWQDVRLVSFDIPTHPDRAIQINPGDCLTIYPKNFPQDVQKVISLMEWDNIADQPLDLSLCPLPSMLHTPSSSTLRNILIHNIDINAVPKRSFLKNISYFSDNKDHKDRLLEFTMTEFLDEYFDYATRSRRTIIEVLEEFYSVRVPAERIIDVFPLIRGRDFSIANHPQQQQVSSSSSSSSSTSTSTSTSTRIELLVALVKYSTILRKPRQGLCSRYISSLPALTTLSITIKPVLSPIHGHANSRRPLIAFATGTGIAPVRSLIQERLTYASQGDVNSPAPTLLFFGNRNKDADYFFSDEWQCLVKEESLSIFTAFSRDQREKIYVQDLIREQADRLAELIALRPIFAVCGGSSKMADACKNAVFDPFLERGLEEVQRRLLDEVTWWQEIW
ncbi:NAPDH-dependent diflavin reductase [Conoideocrella luteorostrata]|uniref:NADPH-dependent diflavin oxidoreductase 1 n=1 Tax=Conoideocrella luteorostrata TaxID=1105319 RepID=A0AAJ0FUQ8_9HYPO|nr:NAPDH-dependent diflavin reductase [Conoideocrella luteorostrata]